MSQSFPIGEPSAPLTARTPELYYFGFTGSAGEFFRIWIVNFCLTVLTLGIYSAWAKVRTARYFAAHTHFGGASFDYLADPKAILKGRMIVFSAVFVYSVASTAAPMIQPVLGLALFLCLPWAVYRSLSFRAHNTTWRNIRFAFGGTYGEAFIAYFVMPLVGVATAGIAYPYALFRQRQFMVDNAAFGTTRFRFGSSPRDFYWMIATMLGVGLGGFIVAMILTAVGGGLLNSVLEEEDKQSFAMALGFLAVFPVYFAMFAAYAARIMNLTYNGARLGEHTLECRIPILELGWIYLSNAALILLSVGLLIPWSHVRLTKFRLSHMHVVAMGSLDDFAAAQGDDVNSLGSEFGDAFDFDLGL